MSEYDKQFKILVKNEELREKLIQDTTIKEMENWTTPAWIEFEQFLKSNYAILPYSEFVKKLNDFISQTLSSELQAVLGEARTETYEDAAEEFRLIGWNAHREACLKRGRERGIIK